MTRQPYDLGPCLTGPNYPVLRAALELAEPGVALEFGVGAGTSTRIIAEQRRVIGFDSFQGLPEDWRPGFPAGRFAQPAPPVIPNTTLIVGRFEETLLDIDLAEIRHVALVHIDCDLYSSTATVLRHLGPILNPGLLIVFDEWHGYPGCEEHEQRAWKEYAAKFTDHYCGAYRQPSMEVNLRCCSLDWEVIGHGDESWGIQLV